MSPGANNGPVWVSPMRSRHSGLSTGVFLLLLVALALLANVWKENLQIGEVTVRGNRIIPDAEVIALSGIERKEPLFEVDLFQVLQRLLRNPFMKSVSVERESPGRIALTVVERTPVAAVALGRIHFIDDEGYVLPPVLSEEIIDIPVITGHLPADELVSGGRVSSATGREVLAALEALRGLGDGVYRRISEVHVASNGELVLFTVEGAVPVLVGNGDYGRKLVALAAFWNQVAMRADLHRLEHVDLRYNDQVVVRWRKNVQRPDREGVQSTGPEQAPDAPVIAIGENDA